MPSSLLLRVKSAFAEAPNNVKYLCTFNCKIRVVRISTLSATFQDITTTLLTSPFLADRLDTVGSVSLTEAEF